MKMTVDVPNRYDIRVVRSIEARLSRTAACPNSVWHNSAPVRAIELCPECVAEVMEDRYADGALW